MIPRIPLAGMIPRIPLAGMIPRIPLAGLLALGSFCLSVSAGCAPPYVAPQPLGKAIDSSPLERVERGEALFTGARGTVLYARYWRPSRRIAPNGPRAAFVIVHGLRDHGERYGRLVDRLVEAGIAVHAADLRGHGRSGGERVEVRRFDDYLEDLDVYLRRVRARERGRPLFVFGHSMGGAIVALHAIERQPRHAGIVLCAAALRLDLSPLVTGPAKLVAALFPHAKLLRLDMRYWSRDPEVRRRNLHDPLVYQPPGPARTAAELFRAVDRIRRRMEDVRVPLLVLHGTADRITDPRGSRELVRRAAARDKTLKLYDGAYHDLLGEPERERVIADILAFVEQRLSATPRAQPGRGP